MRKTLKHLMIVAAVSAALSACADGTGTSAPTSAPTMPAVSPATTGTTVTATMTEYAISLSQTAFTPGSYTFVATQAGQRPHALAIKGPGIDQAETATIQPGGAAENLTVTLQPGKYVIWCPVGNHKAQGMVTTITVG